MSKAFERALNCMFFCLFILTQSTALTEAIRHQGQSVPFLKRLTKSKEDEIVLSSLKLHRGLKFHVDALLI